MKFMYSDVYENRRIIFPSHPLSLTHTHIFSFILQSGIEELITDYSPHSLTIVVSIFASLFYLYKFVLSSTRPIVSMLHLSYTMSDRLLP